MKRSVTILAKVIKLYLDIGWYLLLFTTLVLIVATPILIASILVLVAWLLVLHQLRALFRSVTGGTPFEEESARRIRRVGVVVVGWQFVAPLAKYFVGRGLIGKLTVPGVTFEPPIEFNVDALFLSMAIFILAELFRQAGELQREQSLTV